MYYNAFRYLGDIIISFNDRNKIVAWKGNPIYLDKSIKEGE